MFFFSCEKNEFDFRFDVDLYTFADFPCLCIFLYFKTIMLHAMILIIFFLIHFAEAYNFSCTAKRKSLIVNFMRIYYYFDAFIFLIFIS